MKRGRKRKGKKDRKKDRKKERKSKKEEEEEGKETKIKYKRMVMDLFSRQMFLKWNNFFKGNLNIPNVVRNWCLDNSNCAC